METKEIMTTEVEDVMEATEEIASAGSGKALKVAAGVGLVALAGGLLYKFVAKPLIKKAKAKKEQQDGSDECIDVEADEVEMTENVD